MGCQRGYDFKKNKEIWFDVGYAFGKRKHKNWKHGKTLEEVQLIKNIIAFFIGGLLGYIIYIFVF